MHNVNIFKSSDNDCSGIEMDSFLVPTVQRFPRKYMQVEIDKLWAKEKQNPTESP